MALSAADGLSPLGTAMLAALGAALLLLAAQLLSSGRRGRLPPGPPHSFFTGTSIPDAHPWRTMAAWTRSYGDVCTVRVGAAAAGSQQLLFVVGSARAAQALLMRQAASCSGRPRSIMAGELISGGMRMLTMDHNDRWRTYRKVMHEALADRSAQAYEPVQLKESRIAMQRLGACDGSGSGSEWQNVWRTYAASVIMTVTYDAPVTSLDDPRVRAVNERLGQMARYVRPGASMLDRFPLLRYLPAPLNPWVKLGRQLHARELELFLSQYHGVRSRTTAGQGSASFASKLQERQAKLGLSDAEGAYMAGSLFGAGSDTTAAALSVFIMAMLRFPHVLKQAAAEVDRVVGDRRMPTFEDETALPFIQACVQETMRWRPVSAGGFAHRITADMQWEGNTLPKGSSIIGNHWSISLDENEYPEADVFKPERFLDERGKLKGTWFAPQDGHVGFGFGRRICPGMHVARRSLFINLASVAWAFNVTSSVPPEEIDTLAFTSAANSHPLPFPARFEWRSEARRAVCEDEVQTTKDNQIHA